MGKIKDLSDKLDDDTIKIPRHVAIMYFIMGTSLLPLATYVGNLREKVEEAQGMEQGIELMHTIYNTQGGNEMLNPAYYANNEDFL